MAQIVYDGPDGVERLQDIEEEDLWYHADTGYWVVKMAEEEEGMNVLRRIPDTKVYYVEQHRTDEEIDGTWAPEFE
jgi:hypothetical protein